MFHLQAGDRSNESVRGTTADLFSSVLLIEDDPAHAKLISRALAGIVGDVTHVASGNEALRALETSLPELVFCDLHLPDMTGFDLLGAMKSARPGLPIIVMTSSSNLEDGVTAMRLGASDYMVKQFSSDLRDRIQIVVDRIAERRLQQMREFQMRAERDAFWAAAHTAQDGLAILGAEGFMVFANEAFVKFCRQLDNSAEPPINIMQLIEKADPGVATALSEQLCEQGGDSLWSSELQVPTYNKEGEKSAAFFELTLTSVKLEQLEELNLPEGQPLDIRRYVMWVRNITRRKEEERFQRDLLSTTSHDLKGPLGAILNSAELLTEGGPVVQEKGAELVTRIASCARNSISIIDELLSARRIQDGVMVVKPNWYSVADFLEDTVLDYLPIAKAKKIEFSSRPVPSNLKVFADRIGLTRILGNLVSNALKFTPQGGKVELAAERRGNEVRISITDTGPGIEAKARHLLFERYARLEKHRDIEGTGLGLYVTKNIVSAHNGRIDVQSEVGVGTTFVVTLPDEVTEAGK